MRDLKEYIIIDDVIAIKKKIILNVKKLPTFSNCPLPIRKISSNNMTKNVSKTNLLNFSIDIAADFRNTVKAT